MGVIGRCLTSVWVRWEGLVKRMNAFSAHAKRKRVATVMAWVFVWQCSVLLSLALVLGLEVSSRTLFESLALALKVKSLTLALALRVKSLALSKSPWPRQVDSVNLIFQGTSEPQKPWHAIACYIALIALSLFIAWTCATVELLILSFCVLSHP